MVESCRELGKRCKTGWEVYLGFLITLRFVTPYWQDHAMWMTTVTVCCSLTAGARWFFARQLTLLEVDRLSGHRRLLQAALLCHGLVWGVFTAATLAWYARQWTAQAVFIGTAALLSGAVHRFAPSRMACTGYVLGMLVPSLATTAWTDVVFALMISPYIAYMLVISRYQARDWRQSVEDRLLIGLQRHQLEDLNRLLEGMDVGLALVDERDVIMEVNPCLCELTRRPRERLVGQVFSHILVDGDRQEDSLSFRGLFGSEGDAYQSEVRCRQGTGDVVWLNMSVSIMPSPGSVRQAVRALTDISDRRLQQVVQFQETERRLLAAELHDVISQPLTGLFYGLQQVPGMGDLEARTKTLLGELRRLMRNLHGPQGQFDVRQALLNLVEDYRGQCEVDFSANLSDDLVLLDGLRGIFLHRIVSESLANVLRHARAGLVTIDIDVVDGRLQGSIHDDGIGFDVDQVDTQRHFGLSGMRARCELLGGSLAVHSSEEHGTEIEFDYSIL
jgi:PAS domain S-box-containing protein